MQDDLDRTLHEYYRQFDRDHDRLRDELVAALPVSPAGSRTAADGAPSSDGALSFPADKSARSRRARLAAFSRLAAAVVVAAGLIALVAWLSPGPARASNLFAAVVDNLRAVRAVSYACTVSVVGQGEQTARVWYSEPGMECRVSPGGAVQVSRFDQGRVLYTDPAGGWAALVEMPTDLADTLGSSLMNRLRGLGATDGRFLREEWRDGVRVNVFAVAGPDGSERITLWADASSDLPVRVAIEGASKSGRDVRVMLTDFDWSPPVDAARFSLTVPAGVKLHRSSLPDPAQPVDEADLSAALEVICRRSGGVFPLKLTDDVLKQLLDALPAPDSAIVDTGIGLDLVVGSEELDRADESSPALVRLLTAMRDRLVLRRGAAFLNGLTERGLPWRYVGAGAKAGLRQRVLWYRPEAEGSYRVIYADGTVAEVSAEDGAE